MPVRPMTLYLLLCAILWCALAAVGQTIVTDGKPCAVIVTAVKPTPSAQHAATELQQYIARISGATLPSYAGIAAIPAAERTWMRLYVGHSEAVAALGVAVPSGDNVQRTCEGFVLKTVPSGLVLAGNEDANYHGTEYAVYDLLERLGCRWFFPGPFGEVVPAQRTLAAPRLDETQRPSFLARAINPDGFYTGGKGFWEWLLCNKGTTTAMFDFPGDGTLTKLAPPAKYAKDFPEIYGVDEDGVRRLDKQESDISLCVTNPKTAEIAARTIKEQFRQHPEVTSFGFSVPDAAGGCRCANCLSANHLFKDESDYSPFDDGNQSISDSYYNFVNNVAWDVSKEFPHHSISVLAYANHFLPPEGLDQPWNQQIIVMIAPLRTSLLQPFDDPKDIFSQRYVHTLQAWARICPRLMVYDYELSDLTRMPFWTVPAIQQNIPFYQRYHVIGFATEAINAPMRTGLNYYIRAKLMWDVHADVDALLKDFYAKFFGPAAPPMQRFIEGIQQMKTSSTDHITWSHNFFDYSLIYPPDKLKALGPNLDQADALANTDALKQHIRAFRSLYNYMMTYQEILTLERDGQYTQALHTYEKLAPAAEVAEAIQPGLLPAVDAWSKDEGESTLQRYLAALADRADGKLGRRLALAPREAQFRTDPHNEGFYLQWQRDDVAEKEKWDTILLTHDWAQQGYRDAQGRGYEGYAWYRCLIDVPKLAAGETAYLYIAPSDRGQPGLIAERAWIWVNGHLVASPTQKLPANAPDIDITRWLKPGAKNSVTFYLYSVGKRSQHFGLMDRPLIWAKPKAAK